jgi:hypothetical protein
MRCDRGFPLNSGCLAGHKEQILKKTKLRGGLSSRAKYTDRATAACKAKLVPTFPDIGCHVVSVTDPYGRILFFLNRRCYFFYKVAHSCTHEAEWTPFQTHYFSENLVESGIESGPLDL